MNIDLLYSWLVAASQIFLIGWTGVLIAACFVTFRETPARASVTNQAPSQR